MLSHASIWAAIDRLAERNALSASALARKAGLDPTTFNRSKRVTQSGRPRWPSTESIAKVLAATGEALDRFLNLVEEEETPRRAPFHAVRHVPLIGLAQAGVGGFFDDGGFPAGQGWNEVAFPDPARGEGVYALEVSGDSMLPLYRHGDVIIVSPSATCRVGDRVVLRSRAGEVMAKVLVAQEPDAVALGSINPAHPLRVVPTEEIASMARILWASQ